uniref:breast cancer type 2 susceptibility protein n=1 Tax=Doryrhamphus excisus TaxID=161450 RepID=UPI0025AE6469|nr:breast cancer type 2 susceptibility protein [Doryrhamphus excisus]
MDFPPGSMYNTLTEEVLTELGPVDPDWFKVLTQQASALEGNASDQEDLCANQEGNFKTPLEKPAVESQLFSTPKVFRRACVFSPDTEDEQEKETLPWATRSPNWFHPSKETAPGSKYGEAEPHTHDFFNLLYTPQKSPLSYTQHISESLGANIHPDISWTSSLNTPPALPSTLILSKRDESPCSVPFFEDKNVMFVRKLFPSLSNVSGNAATSPHSNDPTVLVQDAEPPEFGPHPDSPKSPQNSQNHNSDVWRQKLPDAIQDGELRRTVASVLEGAENTLSVFFTSSHSPLRKVKRSKRRLSVLAEERDSSAADSKTAPIEQGESDVEACGMPAQKSPVKSEAAGHSQWSPLRLSEIPATTVETRVAAIRDKCTAQMGSQCLSDQPVRSSLIIPNSGLIRKKRTFVYTIEKERLKDSSTQGFDLHGEQIPKARDEANGFNFSNNPQQQEEAPPPSHRSSAHDLDMSQLCRAFAQDFSQTFNSVAPPKAPRRHPPRGDAFSPSACLTAMKVARQNAKRQASLDDSHNESIVEGAAGDSGFLSAGADVSHVTASSALPSSHKPGPSQQRTTALECTSKDPNCDDASAQTFLSDQTIKVPALASVCVQNQHDSQLTASQKADVTELCTLLEEADSQFEFTQFRTANSNQSGKGTGTISPKADKELDADFLSGIDFDDSFDAEKQANLEQSYVASKPTLDSSPSLIKKENNVTSASSEFIPGRGGFKTADGNIVRDSETCFSTWRKSDGYPRNHREENHVTFGNDRSVDSIQGDFSSVKPVQNALKRFGETDACPRGFRMAGGKTISISSKARQKVKAFFKDCTDSDVEQHLVRTEPVTNAAPSSLDPVGFCTANGRNVGVSAEAIVKSKRLLQEEDASTQTKQGPALHAVDHQPSGFQTAGGKTVSVSSFALKKAKSLLDGVEGEPNCEDEDKKAKSVFRSCEDEDKKAKSVFRYGEDEDKKAKSVFRSGEDEDKKAKSVFRSGEDEEKKAKSVFRSCEDEDNNAKSLFRYGEDDDKKAKSVFRPCEDEDKPSNMFSSPLVENPKSVTDLADPTHEILTKAPVGFWTAGGKRVSVSSFALKKAKSLLDGVEGEPNGSKTLHSRPSEGEFLSARGKQRSTSSLLEASSVPGGMMLEMAGNNNNNMEKTESCVDVDFVTNVPKANGRSDIKNLQSPSLDNANQSSTPPPFSPKNTGSGSRSDSGFHASSVSASLQNNKEDILQSVGFQTAAGKRVSVCCAALKKAKSLFHSCEDEDKKAKSLLRSGEDEDKKAKSVFRSCEDEDKKAKSVFRSCEDDDKKAKSVFRSGEDEDKKAKSVFRSGENEDKPSNNMFSSPLVQNPKSVTDLADPTHEILTKAPVGFWTAGGKRVAVSSFALKKAKSLLDGVEGEPNCEDEDKKAKSVFRSGEDVDKKAKSVFHSGKDEDKKAKSVFRSGEDEEKKAKSVFRSGEDEDKKAKSVFRSGKDEDKASGNMFSSPLVENPKSVTDLSDPMKSDESLTKAPVGFRTAGGKRVSVSCSALKKAEFLFSDCNQDEDKSSENLLNTSHLENSTPRASTSNGGGFCTAGGKKVLVFDDAMTPAKTLLDERLDKPQHHNNVGFQTASGKGVAVSSAALENAKSLFSGCDENEEQVIENMLSVFNPADSTPSRNGAKKVPVCDDAANSLLDESIAFEGLDKAQYCKNAGFQTASNKGASVSCAALKTATSLFECHEDDDKICGKMTLNVLESDPNASTSNNNGGGFCTASGKKVLVSNEAIARVKSLLDESVPVEGSDDAPQLKDTGFKTANGKATILLNECNDLQHKTNTASQRPQLNDALLNVKALFADVPLPNISNVTDMKVTLNTPRVAALTQDENSREEKPEDAHKGVLTRPQMLHCEVKHMYQRDTLKLQRPEEASVVNFQSLDMSDCTETQQIYLAQEALDCTKALLEDESLAGSAMTLDRIQPTSSHSYKTAGKRSAEHAGLTDQPPLKRSLLEEFDRTVNRTLDTPRGSRLYPQTSSPNGVMKDRPVFKYGASRRPNITRPHRDGVSYVEITSTRRNSTAGGSSLPFPKSPSYAPPFFKKKQALQSNVCRNGNASTPPSFVPPFKKPSIIQQSSTKTCAEDVDVCRSAHVSGKDFHTAASEHPNPVSNQTPSSCHGAENINRSQEMMLENNELARDMQDMRIMKKKRHPIRPLPGRLFQTKTSGLVRTCLKEAVGGKPPVKYTQKELYEYGVHRHVSQITSETAEAFRFNLQHFYNKNAFADKGAVRLADGGHLVPSRDGTAGKEQFYRALCDTPGVDPKLLSEEWVYNHYRWIVWKLASMERSFPQTMGSLCLTPERVLLQLKYRYDVEVDHSRRPALRKIMEHDDTSAKTLVLCVCGIVSQQNRNEAKPPQVGSTRVQVENLCSVVWLTDGWYAIKAQLDEPLSAMLVKGRLAVGGKIMVHGAQLVGSQQACSPLDAPESLMLKIFANSSRPARWDAKLGFYRDPRPFLLPLSSLYPNGGPVGCMDVVVLRSYPMQWMERKQDEGVVFRSARAEEKEVARYSSHKQKATEMLIAKIQAQFEEEEKESQHQKRSLCHQEVSGLQDGQELYEAVGEDLAGLEAHLSAQQLETLQAYRRTLMEKKQAELQDRYRRALEKAEDGKAGCLQRDVTPVWRLCVADSLNPTGNIHQLNLWRPSSDLQALLKEGCRYKVYNLATSDGRKRSGLASVQLTGTKKTLFQHIQTSPKWLSVRFQPRVSTNFVDLQDSQFQPLCGEVDLTGCIVTVVDGQGPSPAFYLADQKLNFVKVRCFSSLLQTGLVDVVKPRVLLALSNLQLRGQSLHPTPVVYAGDLTNFSTNPKEAYLQESLDVLRNLLRDQNDFFLSAEEKLSHLLKSNVRSSVCSPAVPPKTPTFASDNQCMKTTAHQPVRSLGCFTPASRNPPLPDKYTEKDPKSLKRRRALDFLSRVPSPPPPPLFNQGPGASPAVKKTFNPPRRSGTPSTLRTVQTPAPKPVPAPAEEEWVNDEELAMIDTQALRVCDSH